MLFLAFLLLFSCNNKQQGDISGDNPEEDVRIEDYENKLFPTMSV